MTGSEQLLQQQSELAFKLLFIVGPLLTGNLGYRLWYLMWPV